MSPPRGPNKPITLDGIAQGSFELLELNRKRLRYAMRSSTALVNGKRCHEKAPFSRDHLAGATELARAVACLMKEARQLEKDAAQQAQKLTYEERRGVLADFFESMPEGHQKEFVQDLTRRLNGRRVQVGA